MDKPTRNLIQRATQDARQLLETEYQEIDNVYLVMLTVSWVDRNRPRYLVIETRLDGKGTYSESEEEQTPGGGGAGGGGGGGEQGGGR